MQIDRERMLTHATEALHGVSHRLPHDQQTAALKRFLKIETERMRIRHRFGLSGGDIVSGISYLVDLVVCHGDFLNADHEYVHKNKNVKGFGTYGDIMIRDRKMYVAPTPFGLTTGTAHNQTLILPADFPVDSRFRAVGKLVRREAQKLIVGYRFDLRTKCTKRCRKSQRLGTRASPM